MRHIMVCISGFSGSGKDECASQLLKNYNAVQTGLADPAKRHMADVYGFTEQQLFGPSHFRNAGDLRYPKNNHEEVGLKSFKGDLPTEKDGLVPGQDKNGNPVFLKPETRYWVYEGRDSRGRPFLPAKLGKSLTFVEEGDPEFWLSPREVLQQYCERLNNLYINTWVRKGVEDQIQIATGKFEYSRMGGVTRSSSDWTKGKDVVVTCFADFRHIHEFRYTRKFAKHHGPSYDPVYQPILVRVKRPSVATPPYDHRSETEQIRVRDEAFDAIIDNSSTLESLYASMDQLVDTAISGKLPQKEWLDEYVLPSRRSEEGYTP